MTITLEWDGADRVGPVYLGMTLDECRKAVPGVYDDRPDTGIPEFDEDDIGSAVSWNAEGGTMIVFRHDVATSVLCNDHFIWQGTDLIGKPLDVALQSLGGPATVTTDMRPKGIDFVTIETELGPEVWADDGIVTCISINRYENDD